MHPHPTNSPEGHSYGKEDEEHEKWDSDLWKDNEDYLFGIDLYNYHYYWEAHEAWEGLWIAAVNYPSIGFDTLIHHLVPAEQYS